LDSSLTLTDPFSSSGTSSRDWKLEVSERHQGKKTRVSLGSRGRVPGDFISVRKNLIIPRHTVGETKGVPIDVGASSMIVNGQIKVKSGPKFQAFDETGALFDDGSRVDADVVVIATG